MADNYLEKQMEALRSGRLSIKAKPGIRPNSKRILIAGATGPAYEKALEFRKEGYRVAVFDVDELYGKRMAHDHGVRFHHIDPKDENAIKKEIYSLLNAWRGIDIIVADEKSCRIMETLVKNWKENLPIKDESTTEIVIISNMVDHDAS